MKQIFIALCAGAVLLAGAAAHANKDTAPGQSKKHRTEVHGEVQASAEADWQVYNRHGQTVTARQIADAISVEAAVKKAGAAPESQEAAMIRISMGQSAEIADKPNDGVFDGHGQPITQREAAERLAAIEIMQRSGIDPNSEKAAQIRAAAQGRVETESGEEVNQQTMAEVGKEIAVQEAIIFTGAAPGSADESLIRMGADVLMDKFRKWTQ
ncbi:hypothetical protein HCU74_19375 [Spongiibacter sp. KMU-166]|uniref:Uncharacterized protein n=1 Tax=Spongiibacter thalassae TaxID=2721624 RepID=A0ABX1GK01_9GAMM|nr:hypothetical protein [Spongiibacter thalassae]NKI19574.1 hypothetical protein [Spongiibacter thalassae]